MDILILGGGGREHALAYGVRKSPDCGRLIVAPGNAGIAAIAECAALEITDPAAVTAFARREKIDFVIAGPEAPLVAGVADALREAGILCFGPSRAAAMLEASKAFTKELCEEAGAPTARYARFSDHGEAVAYVRREGAPIVVKADGLAAGKGVTVAADPAEAEAALEAIFGGAFGEAGAEVVIEEMLTGVEASFFVLSDGENILPLGSAQDHKRAFDGDQGPNTGGMGAFSPAPAFTREVEARTLDEIIRPCLDAMRARGTPFQGVLFAGLMIEDGAPKLIEFNVRFGDPEAEALCLLMGDAVLPALLACARGELKNHAAALSSDAAMSLVIAAKGYPGAYAKGEVISGLEAAAAVEGVEIFHAGTALKDGEITSAGGRVLVVTARAAEPAEARRRAYEAAAKVVWPGGFYRSDIGAG